MKAYAFVLSVGLSWLFVAQAPALAAGEDGDGAKAAVRFQRAVELYREGSYEGALAEFRKAYQISPTYRVLYNIAQSQYALHDFVGAYKSLVEYMTEGSGEIPAERRTQVDEMFAKLRERIGQLQITTNIVGADIRIDDVSVGTSPLPGLIAVNVGTRKVSAFKAGSPEAVRVVTVAGKESMKIDLTIDEGAVAKSPQVASGSVVTSAPTVVRSSTPSEPSRTPMLVAISATAALAVGTAAFGYLALSAQHDLNNQVNTYPNTRNNIEDARSKSKTYGYVTDALGAATLVAGGAALYLALTYREDTAKARQRKMYKTIVLAPSVAPNAGGMLVQGRF